MNTALFAAAALALSIAAMWRFGLVQKAQEALTRPPETPNQKAQALSGGVWLSRWAYLPEFLSVLLTLSWAWFARDSELFRWVFAAGFLSFVAFRALSVPAAVDAFQARRWGLFAGAAALAFGSLLLLLATSLFDLVNSSGDERQARVESGKPAQALDQQISETQGKIAALAEAGYADGKKAAAESKANRAAAQSRTAEIAALQAQIQAAESAAAGILSANAAYMNEDCSPKTDRRGQPFTSRAGDACQQMRTATANVSTWQARIDALSGARDSSDAQDARSSYESLQAHLTQLTAQRAALSSSGNAPQEAWRWEDRFLATVFGITPEAASYWKWGIFAAAFDALALLARVVARLLFNIAGGNPQAEARRKFNALLAAGYAPEQAAAMLAGGGGALPPPAGVLRTGAEIPALDTGGLIIRDGLAVLHQGERVLNRDETARYSEWERAQQAAQGQQQDAPSTTPRGNCAGCKYCNRIGGAIFCMLGHIKNEFNEHAAQSQTCGLFTPRNPQGAAQANDLSKPMAKEANDLSKPMAKEANDYKPMTTKANGLQVIKCESCGAEVKQRTVWQRFCKPCSLERKAAVMRSKKRVDKSTG